MGSSALTVVLKHLALRDPVRFGSFGEYVFAHVARTRGSRVVNRKEGRIDFELDGMPVEIKATAQRIDVSAADLAPRPWSGARDERVAYVRVEFLLDGVRVSREGEVWGELVSWPDADALYDEWRLDRAPGAPVAADATSRERARPCVEEAQAICRAHGRHPKVVYRTCRKSVALKNPPPLDTRRGPGVVHVFISFLDAQCRRDEIVAVFAIPDEDMDALARLPARGCAERKPRIDLRALGTDHRFRNLDDFRKRFFMVHRIALATA